MQTLKDIINLFKFVLQTIAQSNHIFYCNKYVDKIRPSFFPNNICWGLLQIINKLIECKYTTKMFQHLRILFKAKMLNGDVSMSSKLIQIRLTFTLLIGKKFVLKRFPNHSFSWNYSFFPYSNFSVIVFPIFNLKHDSMIGFSFFLLKPKLHKVSKPVFLYIFWRSRQKIVWNALIHKHSFCKERYLHTDLFFSLSL